jgi:protein-disulfide isomerase
MSYFYKFCVFLLFLAAAYTLFGLGVYKWMHHSVKNPKAEFLVSGNLDGDLTLIEFMNHGCGYCKDIYPVISELKEVRKDLRFVVYPILLNNEDMDKPTRLSIAAGLQGKFEEMNQAFLEYPETEVPDDFVEETANLYGLNYEQLVMDARGEKVEEILEDNFGAIEGANIYSVPSFMFKNKIYVVTENNLPDLKQMLEFVSPENN